MQNIAPELEVTIEELRVRDMFNNADAAVGVVSKVSAEQPSVVLDKAGVNNAVSVAGRSTHQVLKDNTVPLRVLRNVDQEGQTRLWWLKKTRCMRS